MARTAVLDFSLANPIYVAATVTFYTVDPATGVKSTTLANLYAQPTGAQALPNPQVLDSQGKFKQPVYIADPVIAVVSGLTVPDHQTGVIQPIDDVRLYAPQAAGAVAAAEAKRSARRAKDSEAQVMLAGNRAQTAAAAAQQTVARAKKEVEGVGDSAANRLAGTVAQAESAVKRARRNADSTLAEAHSRISGGVAQAEGAAKRAKKSAEAAQVAAASVPTAEQSVLAVQVFS